MNKTWTRKQINIQGRAMLRKRNRDFFNFRMDAQQKDLYMSGFKLIVAISPLIKLALYLAIPYIVVRYLYYLVTKSTPDAQLSFWSQFFTVIISLIAGISIGKKVS